MNQKLKDKISEAFSSVLPISAIVLLASTFLIQLQLNAIVTFVVGAALLTVGMGLFTLGAEMSMTPMGEGVGSSLGKGKALWPVLTVGFVLGFFVTISEPDLSVLANQVLSIPNAVLLMTVAAGVGLFLGVALLRNRFGWKLSNVLLALYALTFAMSLATPPNFLPVAFDSGGVTTGPMTVPFILALGVGLAGSARGRAHGDGTHGGGTHGGASHGSGSHGVGSHGGGFRGAATHGAASHGGASHGSGSHGEGSFGFVAICSVGPILAVMTLGILYNPQEVVYMPVDAPAADTLRDVVQLFARGLPHQLRLVAIALAPIVALFGVFQAFTRTFRLRQIVRMAVGMAYVLAGLVLFLTGVEIGFIPVGSMLGRDLVNSPFAWLLVPIGMVIGYFIVSAEPAVAILNKQVEELSGGAISSRSMKLTMSVGVAVSVGLAMTRVLTGLPIYFLLVPGYAIAFALTRFSPELFTNIAFDSGGVASGPMTSTFLLPFVMGVCEAAGGDVLLDAFGVVAMVAMTPLIAIQLTGIMYKRKMALAAAEMAHEAEAAIEAAEEAAEVAEREALQEAEAEAAEEAAKAAAREAAQAAEGV